MEDISFDIARTALVLIDLQHGIVGRQWAPYSGQQVVGNCVLLSQEVRERRGTVIYVHVQLDQLLSLPADKPSHAGSVAPPPEASHLVPEAQVEATDTVITKRQWGAFYGTELDQVLRRNHIKTIIMAGIATNMGVESTARAAFDRGYELVFAEDAMSSMSAEAHNFSCQNIFPIMGRVRSTAHILKALRAGTGEA
jgi:nicotinamidase-related amidase